MPDGNYRRLSEAVTEKISDWIERGGNLICWQRAASWTAQAGLTNWPIHQRGRQESCSLSFRTAKYVARSAGDWRSDFAARIDATHPLGFGYADGEITLFRNKNSFMVPDAPKTRFPIQYTADPLISGYISDENLHLLRESAGAAISPLGKGKIIGLSDNPTFRAFWYGTNKLLANAIFFGDLME